MDQRKAMPARPHRLVSGASLALVALLLAGCSSTPDWANPVEWYHGVSGWFGGDDPETDTARARAKAKEQATPKGAYPNLSTVPERPKDISNTSQANRVQKGLVADRSQARYTELELTPPPPVPPAPSPAPAQPPVTAAPSAPVVQAAPLPRAPEPPVAETSKPSSGAAPTAGTPPMPPGPPPQAEPPVPETAGRTRETSQSVQAPPAVNRDTTASSSRPDNVAALPEPAPKAPVPPGVQVGTVLFADNSSKVSSSYDKLLKDIANMKKEKGGALRVIGHASPGGQGADALKQRMANFRVSLARANAVARELVRLGVPARDVTVEGRADNEPLYPESAPGGEAGNRRAEIYIDYPKGRR